MSRKPKEGAIEPVGDDWELLFPGEFLRGIDIEGKRPTVKIVKLYRRTVRGKKHPIAELEGKDRKWKINFTNGLCLFEMFGKNPKQWVGRRVTLCTETVRAFGKTQPAIRVYGSPELDREIKVYKDLGEHEIKRTLHRTGNGTPPTQRQPGGEG
jgi:hypothetical protein